MHSVISSVHFYYNILLFLLSIAISSFSFFFFFLFIYLLFSPFTLLQQEREFWSSADPEQTRTIVECLQEEVRTLREQLATAQAALSSAVRSVGTGGWMPPPSLQHWLQLTHELELRHYNAKKAAAEKQLVAAKEGVSLSFTYTSLTKTWQCVQLF